MIEVKNLSSEPFVLVPALAPETPGFRLAAAPATIQIDPGTSVVLTGYEPGVRYEIRPVYDWARPRSGFREVREG